MSEEPEEAPGVVDAAAELAFAVHGVLSRVAAELDLSVTQLRLLGILRDRTPTMAALATQLGLDRSSVSGLVDRAERRGLVRRSPSADDGRSVTVALDDAGRASASTVEALVDTRMRGLLAEVAPADRAALVRVAGTLPRAV